VMLLDYELRMETLDKTRLSPLHRNDLFLSHTSSFTEGENVIAVEDIRVDLLGRMWLPLLDRQASRRSLSRKGRVIVKGAIGDRDRIVLIPRAHPIGVIVRDAAVIVVDLSVHHHLSFHLAWRTWMNSFDLDLLLLSRLKAKSLREVTDIAQGVNRFAAG